MPTKVSEEKPRKIDAGLITGWVTAVLLFIMAATSLLWRTSSLLLPLTVTYILTGLVALPPFWDWVKRRWNFELSRGLKIILFFVILIAIPMVGFRTSTDESVTTPQTVPISTPASTALSAPIVKDIVITKIDNKATEKNNIWWRYSWLVEVKNNTSKPINAKLELKWVDVSRLVLDDQEERFLLGPWETKTVNGFQLIDVQTAPNVKDLEAQIGW